MINCSNRTYTITNKLPEATSVEIVRYLSNEQGLAPEELRPGMFEIERQR